MQQRNRAHDIEPATLIHSSNETTYWQRTIAYQTATAESAQALTLRLAAHIDVVLRGRASEENEAIRETTRGRDRRETSEKSEVSVRRICRPT